MIEVIFNWISRGLKFAGDINLIQLRVLKHLLFRLFSVMTPANLVHPAFPTTFIQLSWAWQLRQLLTSGFSRSWSSTHSNTGLVIISVSLSQLTRLVFPSLNVDFQISSTNMVNVEFIFGFPVSEYRATYIQSGTISISEPLKTLWRQ